MVTIEKLSNGLTVIVEEMPHVESVAYELLLPGGVITDAPTRIGSSLILGELTSRGAGSRDSKALSDAFDDAGIRHGEGAGHDRYMYRGVLLADKLPLALSLVASMVREPLLPEDELESIKSLLLQDIASLDDNPSRKAMIELGSRYYPAPYNRPGIGVKEGIEASSIGELKKLWSEIFQPSRAIFSVAGKAKASEVISLIKDLFGSWNGAGCALPKFEAVKPGQTHHISSDSAQVQIVLCYPSAKFGEPLYYATKVLVGVLSGGMFGRLFIEVREKRGLCYSVFARHSATTEYGTVLAYAGTTPERADQTLDVMLTELRGVKGTVTDAELSRAKANIKASLIISEESSGSRAGSNAADYWLDKKVRGLDQIAREIDAVRACDIDAVCERFPAETISLLTLGARELHSKD